MRWINIEITSTHNGTVELPEGFNNLELDQGQTREFFFPPSFDKYRDVLDLDPLVSGGKISVSMGITPDNRSENPGELFAQKLLSADIVHFDPSDTSISKQNIQEGLVEALDKSDSADQ